MTLKNVVKFFEGHLLTPTVIPGQGVIGLNGLLDKNKKIRMKSNGDSHRHLKHFSALISVFYNMIYRVGEMFGWEGHRPEKAQTLIADRPLQWVVESKK